MTPEKVDIVIPFAPGMSQRNNWELRMALRSIDAFLANAGQIYLVTDAMPRWCRNVRWIACADTHVHNKDANLFDKLLTACNLPELREKFLFWSDDQLLLRSADARGLTPVYNNRGPTLFSPERRWGKRMLHTFDYLAEHHRHLQWNFDSHVPQPMRKTEFLKLIANVDYTSLPGYCINTLYFGLANIQPLVEQTSVKQTVEHNHPVNALDTSKLFLGYNDFGLENNLPQLVEKLFPNPCRYEM